MSQKYFQPKCKTGGNKWFHTDGSKGSSDRLLASVISSGLSTMSVQTLLSLVGIMKERSEGGRRGNKCKYWHIVMGSSGEGGRTLHFQWCGQWSLVPWQLWLSQCTAFLQNVSLSLPRSAHLSKLIMFSCVNYKKGVSNLTELCFHKHCFSDVCATTLEYDFILSLVITINNLHNSH